MLVAITGTPGTGKTKVCRLLEKKGYSVLFLNELVGSRNEFFSGYDRRRKCKTVDLKKLNSWIMKNGSRFEIVEGHLSHLLSVEAAIVLRCSPKILRKRLEKRGYDKVKIEENIEAEAIDVILIESLQRHKKVYEIDTTGMVPQQVAEAVVELLHGKVKQYKPGSIDWSSEILSWY